MKWLIPLLASTILCGCGQPPQSPREVKDPASAETDYAAPGGPPSFMTSTSVRTPKIQSENVDRKIGGVQVLGYRAEPEQTAPLGAVLLVHEWWGLDESVRKEADALAGLGYKALAVDLYGGRATANRTEAAQWMDRLEEKTVLATLQAALELLEQAEPDGRRLKIGVVGWGMGVGYALRLAMENKRPAALAIFYGEVVDAPERIAKLKCPVLGIFASRDAWVTPARVEAFDQALTAAGVEHEILSLDALPGFMLHPRDNSEEALAKIAREKLAAFLKEKLTAK